MKRFLNHIFYLTLIIYCTSCKEVETKSDTGIAYFPLSIGMQKIFTLDSVTYNAITNKKDSVRTYLKEIITEEKNENDGYTIYKAENYTSKDTLKGWLYKDYYFYKKNEYHINLIKGGSIVTCFVFPVAKGRKWNMNAYNALDPENASYSFVAKPWMNYSDCVEVFVKEDVNVVEEAIDKRIYSRDKGLIYKNFSNITISNSKKNGYKVLVNLLK